MGLPLPREHGAWVMTTLALVAGWNVGPLPGGWSAALATISVLLGVLSQAAWLEAAAPRWIWKTQIGFAGVLAAVVAWREGASFAFVVAMAAALAGSAQFLRMRDKVGTRIRLAAFGAHLAGAGALAGCAALVMAARSMPTVAVVWTWWILALGFCAGVLFVKAVMPGRHRSMVPLFVLALLATATVWVCYAKVLEFPRTFLSLSPVFLRLSFASRLRRTGVSWRTAGWMESAAGLWCVYWQTGAFG